MDLGEPGGQPTVPDEKRRILRERRGGWVVAIFKHFQR
jgi:hypothetical protein